MPKTKPEDVDNPRMKAFIYSGGGLYNDHGSYTNHKFMNWMSNRWKEWQTKEGIYKETWERTPMSKEQHKEFDRWLQQYYGKTEWFHLRYPEEVLNQYTKEEQRLDSMEEGWRMQDDLEAKEHKKQGR